MPNDTITLERAARRFHQLASIEHALVVKSEELAACKAHLKDLTAERDGLVLRLRAAARDEGELPLFGPLED